MLLNLKRIVKHSAVYSVGNVATKAIGIVLLPLYTHYIPLASYGTLAIIEASLFIGVGLLTFGQTQALIIFSASSERKIKKESVFLTTLVFILVLNITVLVPTGTILRSLSGVYATVSEYKAYIIPSCIVVLLRNLVSMFFTKLRSDEKSVQFMVLSVIKLVTTLALTIYFVAYKQIGIIGILYAYIAGEATTLFLFIPFTFRDLRGSFDWNFLREAVAFGYPLIVASLASALLNISDRYVLKALTNDESVAIYDLGYRIAGFVNMFIIMPFNLAFVPIASKMFNQEGDKRYFSKMMTYVTFLLIWAALALSLFSKEIVMLFALDSSYYPAYTIVPLIAFSYVFVGMQIVAGIGLFLTGKTKLAAVNVLIAGLSNVLINYLLIPLYGPLGAGYTNVISFGLFFITTNLISQRYYSIPFEYAKLVKITLLGVIFFVLLYSLTGFNPYFVAGIKCIAVISYPVALYFLNFFEPIEIERIKGFYNKWKDPKNWDRSAFRIKE